MRSREQTRRRRERARERWFAALVALLAGAGLWVGAAAAAGAGTAPERLAETGLYADFANRILAPGILAFAPQYPLWTDGASKRRWILLPPDGFVDASDPDAWSFPVGTRIWKEFSFGRPVETRYMERTAEGWTYATYLWSADGAEAARAPERGMRGVVEIGAGVRHDLPGRYDCLSCHEGNVSPVLGFSALQLSSDRDPLAPHTGARGDAEIDLAGLVAIGRVRGLPATLVAAPPRIAAESAVARAALGYLHGNCSSCHNDRGPLASLGLSLEVRLAPGHAPGALTTAVGRRARLRPGGRERTRIVPGDPDASLLVERIGSRQALLQMPPLGSQVADSEAIALVRDWITHDLALAVVSAGGEPEETIRSTPNDKENLR